MKIRWSIINILLLLLIGLAGAQPADYVGNKLPTAREIQSVIDRVANHFILTTSYRVIDKKTGEEITNFSELNPNAVIDTRVNEFNTWSYTMGVVHSGMLLAGEVTHQQKYIDYVIRNYDFIFDHLDYFRAVSEKYGYEKYRYQRIFKMSALDHCGSIGAALVKTYGKKKDPRYRAMINTVAEYISHKQFRMADGTLARHRPQAVSLWTDDFYMSIPFLAQMGKLTGEKKYWDDAVKQVIQLSQRLFIREKKLYDHGWNARNKYDPKFYWGRANGWAMMAMVELLDVLPENYPGRDKVLDILNLQVEGVAELQDGSGMWHNMLDKTDTYLESSCTAMFVYSIAKAINQGWVDLTYGPVAQCGWNALEKYVLPDGQIENICVGTTFGSDNVYYYNRPTALSALHGYGPVLLAGAEMIKLLENSDIEIVPAKVTFHYLPRKK